MVDFCQFCSHSKVPCNELRTILQRQAKNCVFFYGSLSKIRTRTSRTLGLPFKNGTLNLPNLFVPSLMSCVSDWVPEIGFSRTWNQSKNGFKRQAEQGFSSFIATIFAYLMIFQSFALLHFLKISSNMAKFWQNDESLFNSCCKNPFIHSISKTHILSTRSFPDPQYTDPSLLPI